MTKIVTVANFKGGVGKSTLTEILAYIHSVHKNKSVLVIDTDPQANVTDKLFRTFNKDVSELPGEENRLMGAIEQADLNKAIVSMSDRLDLMVGDWQIERFQDNISGLDKNARYYLLYTLLKDISPKYDYVFIDTRPSTDLMTNNAICASDYVLIASKSEEDSFSSTIKFIEYLKRMADYHPDLNLIGIVNYLVNMRGYVDKQIIQRFDDEFNNFMFENKVKSSEVVKRWGLEGITEDKAYDKKVMAMYQAVADEMNNRINELED